MTPSGYRYSTYWGWYLMQYANDGGRWRVHNPAGRIVAGASSWWVAMEWALQQRPAAS